MNKRLVSGGPHPFGRAFPVSWDSVPSLLSSVFDSADSSGGQPIHWMLGSLFQLAPIIHSSVFPTSNELARLDLENEDGADKGKGKARAMDSDDTDQPGSEFAPTLEDEGLADTIREAIAASRRIGSHIRSPDEAGPSGRFTPALASDIAPPPLASSSRTHLFGSDSEQAEIEHAILISSIEHIENSLHTLQANFIFPTRLDYHLPSDVDSHVSSASPVDEDINEHIATYLLTTPANSTVLNFVRELHRLLRQLDHVNTNDDMEAESMKGKVAGVINRALGDVESEVEEAIGKWMSLQATAVDLVGR